MKKKWTASVANEVQSNYEKSPFCSSFVYIFTNYSVLNEKNVC